MSRTINSVAVLGAGTMGSGIAALCAQAGYPVLLLDMSKEICDKAVERLQAGRFPALEDAASAARISTGSFAEDIDRLGECDWICEAIIENPVAKRDLFDNVIDPEATEFKYYKYGVGFVLAVAMEDGEMTGEREELVCVGDSLDILEDDQCEIDNPEALLDELCKLSPDVYCD